MAGAPNYEATHSRELGAHPDQLKVVAKDVADLRPSEQELKVVSMMAIPEKRHVVHRLQDEERRLDEGVELVHGKIPVVPEGRGKIFPTPFWAYDAVLDPLGVPTYLQWLMSPALVSTVIASELINVMADKMELTTLAAVAIVTIQYVKKL